MQIATLTLSGLAFVASAGTLLIMAKTARELKVGKEQVQEEVVQVKQKMDRNFRRVKAVLSELEF